MQEICYNKATFEIILPEGYDMARIIEIEDLSLPELDVYRRLKDPPFRTDWEADKGIFIAENPKVIAIALRAGYVPVSMLTEKRHISGCARDVIDAAGDIPVYTAGRKVLSGLTGYELTRGVLCAMRRTFPYTMEEICAPAGQKRIAVLEDITDSTNLGAIFRSAAALGVDGVVLSPSCCDPLSRRSIRVSMGTVFQVPWARVGQDTPWPAGALDRFRSLGYVTVALALTDDAAEIDDPRLREHGRLALLLGTEGDGLAPRTISNCDLTVKIPMKNHVDSLNVAAAGAVAFWELRKR